MTNQERDERLREIITSVRLNSKNPEMGLTTTEALSQINQLFSEGKDINWISKELVNTMFEIQKEIESRPQYPNIGKKGCLKRLQDLYDKIQKSVDPTKTIGEGKETCGINPVNGSKTYGCPHCGRPVRKDIGKVRCDRCHKKVDMISLIVRRKWYLCKECYSKTSFVERKR